MPAVQINDTHLHKPIKDHHRYSAQAWYARHLRRFRLQRSLPVPISDATYTAKVSALMMMGDKISAQEALQMGMLYKVFSDETFADESRKIALTLSQMPTKALAFIKHALNQSFSNNLEEQLLLEDLYQQKAAATADFKEGVQAFLEKRSPHFKGE